MPALPVPSSRASRFAPVRRVLARTWVIATLLGVSLLILMGAWAAASPPGSSPDDGFHLASIWCGGGESSGECTDIRNVPSAMGMDQAEVPFKFDSKTCREVTDNGCVWVDPGTSRAFINDGLYPGYFYSAMNHFVGPSLDKSVYSMRFWNGAIFAAMFTFAFVISRQIMRRAFLLAWTALLVPLSAFFIPSTNPTSWAVIGVGTYWVFLYAWIKSRNESRGRKLAAGIGAVIAALLALGARSDGAAYILLSTVVLAIFMSPARERLLEIARKPARWLWFTLPAIIMVVAFVSFARSSQSSAITGINADNARWEGKASNLLINNLIQVPEFFGGFTGLTLGLGWWDIPVPYWTSFIVTAVIAVIVFAGLRYGSARKWIAVGLLTAAIVFLPLYILQVSGYPVGGTVQPRYLLPLVIVAIGLLSLGPMHPVASWSRFQIALVALGLIVANTVAVLMIIKRFFFGVDATKYDITSPGFWWWDGPVPAVGVLGLATISGAVFFAVAWWVIRRPVPQAHLRSDTPF